jgi:hypothetical protein
MFAFKSNIPKLQKKIDEEIRLLQAGFTDGICEMIEEGRVLVSELTPKSSGAKTGQRDKQGRFVSGSGRHIADGWTTHTIGGGGKGRVPILFVIHNKFTHDRAGRAKKNALLVTKSGGQQDYTLLDILEYGSRHTKPIVPVDKKVLRFVARGGQVVYTKSVDHPGTKAHAMVRLTTVRMSSWFVRYARKWADKLARTWSS